MNTDEFLREKLGNLCAYMRATYAGDAAIEALHNMPLFMSKHLIVQHLLPHRHLLDSGDTEALLVLVSDPRLTELARKCRDDEKVLAYMQLFCAVLAGAPVEEAPRLVC